MRVCNHRREKIQQELSSEQYSSQNLLHMPTDKTVLENASEPPSMSGTGATDTWGWKKPSLILFLPYKILKLLGGGYHAY